ncbi:MAG: hypothetical protein AAF197_01335 [Pseudomonadota bacterium]
MKTIKRPILVWIIFILFFLSFIVSFAAATVTFKSMPSVFGQLSGFEIGVSAISGVLNFIAAIQLFRLRANAIWLFFCAFVISALPAIIDFLNGSLSNNYDLLSWGTIVGLMFWVGLFGYLWHLRRNSVLT